MFKFKKSVKGVARADAFECECCGPMEGRSSSAQPGCASGCGSRSQVDQPACGPLGNTPCGTSVDNAGEKSKTSGSCGCSCSG